MDGVLVMVDVWFHSVYVELGGDADVRMVTYKDQEAAVGTLLP